VLRALLSKFSVDEFIRYKNSGGKLWCSSNSGNSKQERSSSNDVNALSLGLGQLQPLSGNHLFAKQPNFCWAKQNKMALAPVKIGHNKFGFPIPRKLYLKPKCSQNIFFNLSLAFPFGTIPIYRPALELVVHRDNIHCQIVNSQDGSTFVSNLILRIRNNNRLPVCYKRGSILVTVLVKNSISDLHPMKVQKISYDIANNENMGMVIIHHE
jgi:hypothetical protein